MWFINQLPSATEILTDISKRRKQAGLPDTGLYNFPFDNTSVTLRILLKKQFIMGK